MIFLNGSLGVGIGYVSFSLFLVVFLDMFDVENIYFGLFFYL